ncbi:hypothetical protein SD72_03750 [Leucobacter komagatae]|uniref:Cyclase n=1 Tax=Leucobacter komagatae TaxID=55969 RepID=A0A0D0IQQ0_9MICO|nr:hypothetical protein SD72_03750 [Leucobacter komagatae]
MVLLIETPVAAPAERCFELSLSIDAHSLSMHDSRERAVAGVTSGVIGEGEEVTWSARHFGIRFRMTSRIVAFAPPTSFVDAQTRGPFAHWWHEHEFVETTEGTLMIDRISFASPCGFIGRAVDRWILARYMANLITRRNDWLVEELESESAGA